MSKENKDYLYKKYDYLKEDNLLKELPDFVEKSLSSRIELRDYQKDALRYFITYYEKESQNKNKNIHTLFHMATGSGKTVIMAGLILYLFQKGYRNFLFFVNQTNILEKTKDNFLNSSSSKYLFSDELIYLGQKLKVNQVDNFSLTNSLITDEINICFTTTQKLHLDLNQSKENSITYHDFDDNKIVFISDESHHINTITKMSSPQKENFNSWEYSVMKVFNKNKDNVLLEFTATADLNDKNVREKYIDKIIYDYPLLKFRESKYTKDFANFATSSDTWERSLMAMIMSEYRKYLFIDAKTNIKPVVLFKSQKIAESEDFYDSFFKNLNKLSSAEITNLKTANIEALTQAIEYFSSKENGLNFLIQSLKNSFSKENSLLINNTKDNTKENQLKLNSLEDKNNNIRFIFAVDMLNEGWDVLNLFDIVRLYDTRQGSGKPGKVGAYTIKEAQLIGRGARYCPFLINEEQERFKRKYDADVGNKYRLLETMYFHSKNDSAYIYELKKALEKSGLLDEESTKIEYKLKDSFKETDIYNNGFVFSNKRVVKKSSNNVLETKQQIKKYFYKLNNITNSSSVYNLLTKDEQTSKQEHKQKTFTFKDIDYHIISAAAASYKELNFDYLKEKYPNLKSLREFLTSENWLGNNQLEIESSTNKIRAIDLFKSLVHSFSNIASYLSNLKQEYEGTTQFYAHRIADVIKDKIINISKPTKNDGHGNSQTNADKQEYRLNLSNENWYVYNDNYGTTEEKNFIKYFNEKIKPELEEIDGIDFYLIRNERIPELAIYSFDKGERFEPDFLLLIQNKNEKKSYLFQIYAEAKGEHIESLDKWKEEFLLAIKDKHEIPNDLTLYDKNYKIFGSHFFNREANTNDENWNKIIGDIESYIKRVNNTK